MVLDNIDDNYFSDIEAQDLQELAHSLGLEYRDKILEISPSDKVQLGEFRKIVGNWARKHKFVPIGEENGHILVATANPTDLDTISVLKACYGKPLRLIVSPPEEVDRIVNDIKSRLMKERDSSLEKDEDEEEEFAPLKIDVTDAEDEDAPIMRYVNAIIFKANAERASDIHIEPFEEEVKIRFRIDGVLSDVDRQDKIYHPSIVSRIKVMAGMDIAEKRLPQDGRIGLKIAGKDVDIRVSTVPTQFGERVVLRLLDKSATILDLANIGLDVKKHSIIDKLIHKPNGIILVTGPTGSGKTTTLYSILSRINTPELNILTVEDPIEYQLDGIGQMQVHPKIGFTFASGLRSILRQDPNVVMVGEIRDVETAEIAVQASLTGHLVFSTLHTNDAPSTITRLLDMGIEPFLISSSLLAVMAQRLVRKLCIHCKEEYTITDEELIELGLNISDVNSRKAFKANKSGCEACQHSGYAGRTGIHELLVINDRVRRLIVSRKDAKEIKKEVLKDGFEPLRIDGARKVLQGITSVEEVLLVTHEGQD